MSTEDVVSERLVRVETKMDVLITQGEQLRLDHEARLRLLESAVTELKIRSGLIAGGIGTGAGVITSIVAQLIAP